MYDNAKLKFTVECKTMAGKIFGESIISEFWQGKLWRI